MLASHSSSGGIRPSCSNCARDRVRPLTGTNFIEPRRLNTIMYFIVFRKAAYFRVGFIVIAPPLNTLSIQPNSYHDHFPRLDDDAIHAAGSAQQSSRRAPSGVRA